MRSHRPVVRLFLSVLLSVFGFAALPTPPAAAEGDPGVLAAVEEFRAGGKAPVLEHGDSIVFPYGESQPVVRCSPLRACDVELEAGEVVHGVALGDTERWITSPLFSGDPASLVPHVIVKPRESGISTNLIVTTTRRTYHLSLVSPPGDEGSDAGSYLRRVRFYYPGDLVQQWSDAARLEALAKDRREDATVASLSGALDPGGLDFGYALAGDRRAPFRPTTVFDDGHHTYIRLPDAVASGDAPAFFARTAAGEQVLLNYRMRGPWIVVDGLFEEAELTLGVGRAKRSVTLRNHSEGSR